jgi:hypothetical protein
MCFVSCVVCTSPLYAFCLEHSAPLGATRGESGESCEVRRTALPIRHAPFWFCLRALAPWREISVLPSWFPLPLRSLRLSERSLLFFPSPCPLCSSWFLYLPSRLSASARDTPFCSPSKVYRLSSFVFPLLRLPTISRQASDPYAPPPPPSGRPTRYRHSSGHHFLRTGSPPRPFIR